MDEDCWFFIVEREKDMIIASGYKIWPREVEDIRYTQPAVSEAAAIGVLDEYRGETEKALANLRDGATVSEEELIGQCRAHLAAYKYPRTSGVRPELLPKTMSGKILRRNLRPNTISQRLLP